MIFCDKVVKWRLYEYVSPLERHSITEWRNGLKTAARKADLDTFLRIQVKIRDWVAPSVKPLSGKRWKGLFELRWKSDGVPHRIGGYFAAPDEFVMLIGFTHNANKYDPSEALEKTILQRKRQIQNGEASLSEYKVIFGQ
jgi:hypothetical protein